MNRPCIIVCSAWYDTSNGNYTQRGILLTRRMSEHNITSNISTAKSYSGIKNFQTSWRARPDHCAWRQPTRGYFWKKWRRNIARHQVTWNLSSKFQSWNLKSHKFQHFWFKNIMRQKIWYPLRTQGFKKDLNINLTFGISRQSSV